MLGQAGETEFDLRFSCFGVPVRVHPFFWVGAAFVIWNSTREPQLKFLGVLCVLLSILVHEMGHAVTTRRYGYPSEIVLHGMGGYATGTSHSTWRRIWVSFAGPLAGFILYGIICGVEYYLISSGARILLNPPVLYSIWLLKRINLYWGLMNLLPVIPLDGGRIMEALVSRYFPRNSGQRVLQISILAAASVCYYGLRIQDEFLIILFGLLCAQSIIAYNELKGSRRW